MRGGERGGRRERKTFPCRAAQIDNAKCYFSHLPDSFDFHSSTARDTERHTLALLIGGEPHHGAATPRTSCDRRADGGKAGDTPTATRPTFQITAPATASAPAATATPGGQHHDGPRGTFARPFSRGALSSRRGPRSSASLGRSPQSSTGEIL